MSVMTKLSVEVVHADRDLAPQAKRRLTLANAPGALAAAAAAAMQSVVMPAAASQKPRQVLKLLYSVAATL
jgi:hypothetical protein